MATSNYPGSLDDYSTLPSSGTPITVSSHYFGPAITNIETELGTDPAGTFTDVKSRLDDVDDKVITEIDQWHITSDVISSAGAVGTFTANWVRTSDLFSVKGTGLGQSSGVFDFPSTGYYRIIFRSRMVVSGGTGLYAGVIIKYTTDNFSSVDIERIAGYNNSYATNSHAHVTLDAIFRISDIANQKIKFNYESQASTSYRGDTSSPLTGFTSIKIGEL